MWPQGKSRVDLVTFSNPKDKISFGKIIQVKFALKTFLLVQGACFSELFVNAEEACKSKLL